MKRTRCLTSALLCLLLVLALAVPASAHGCHGGRTRRYSARQQAVQTSVTVCPVADCATAGRHSHDGVVYCGYCHESGVCDNTCRALCTLEDCCETGRHLHDGVTYCGSDHANGFCDGSCAVPAVRGCGHHC